MRLSNRSRWVILGFGFLVSILTVQSATSSGAEKFVNPVEWKAQTQKNKQGSEKITYDQLMAIGSRYQQALRNSGQTQAASQVQSNLSSLFGQLKNNPIPLNRGQLTPLHSAVKLYNHNGTPSFMSGFSIEASALKASAGGGTHAERLTVLFQNNQELFKLNDPASEMSVKTTTTDKYGLTHVVLDQSYLTIPFWGQSIVAHFDSDDRLYTINARYSPTPENINPNRISISVDEAIGIAVNDLPAGTVFESMPSDLAEQVGGPSRKAKLYIWSNKTYRTPRLVWHVDVRPNIREEWYFFVDASTGEILETYDNIHKDGPTTAQAVDLNGVTQQLHTYQQGSNYRMIDASQPIWKAVQPDPFNDPKGGLITLSLNSAPIGSDIFYVQSPNNTWTDKTAVSASYNVGTVFEYYYNTYNRQAIDDSGSTIFSLIHVTRDNGASMDNAYWNGKAMVYGDGGAQFKPLAGALDVAAHELTHGVIQYTVNLEYKFQPGALNESMADVFGVLVDSDDWFLGEDIVNSGQYPTGALRDMANPHNGGSNLNDPSWQPASMDEFMNLSLEQDNGGVHVNSGIPNHVAYLIGDALGKSKLGAIYYHILVAHYLTAQSQFIDMRLAAIRSATDIYGASSQEVQAVKNAFDAVGITDGSGTQPPEDNPPVDGIDWIAVVNDGVDEWGNPDNSLLLVSPTVPLDTTMVFLLSGNQVFIGTGKPIDVSKDGSLLLFIDQSNNIRLIDIDTGEETLLSGLGGNWSSLALSPDGNKLALTSTLIDSMIHIVDLATPANSKSVKLYSPTTVEGVNAYTTQYSDVMDWDRSSQFLVFDAFNSIPQQGGGSIDYWEVNMLSVAENIIIRLFPPLAEGVSMGNPSFGETNDLYMVFDMIDMNQCTDDIVGVNLSTGDLGLIYANGCGSGFPNIGFPKYSPDDSWMVFQSEQSGVNNINQIPIDQSRINPAGPVEEWASYGRLPVWFSRGDITTDVTDPIAEGSLPHSFVLEQNHPNPFNPSTSISYNLSSRADVKLTVYNLLGQKVVELVNAQQPAGRHEVTWDGRNHAGRQVSSGVYLYRLKAGDYSESRKMVLMK